MSKLDGFKDEVVAITLEQPWAMLANGPPCIITGLCSKVWTKLGLIASFNNTNNDFNYRKIIPKFTF